MGRAVLEPCAGSEFGWDGGTCGLACRTADEDCVRHVWLERACSQVCGTGDAVLMKCFGSALETCGAFRRACLLLCASSRLLYGAFLFGDELVDVGAARLDSLFERLEKGHEPGVGRDAARDGERRGERLFRGVTALFGRRHSSRGGGRWERRGLHVCVGLGPATPTESSSVSFLTLVSLSCVQSERQLTCGEFPRPLECHRV